MSDITTVWVDDHGDYALAGADLASGDDLATAVLISLFTDRQAAPDDPIPDGSGDPRGWHGDDPARAIGSRLWLLRRAKRTPDTLATAQGYCQEALQWLVDDGVAAGFDVFCQWQAQGFLGVQVTLFKRNGTTQAIEFAWAWNGVT